MTLLPYDLSFKTPLFISRNNVKSKHESKKGFLIKTEYDGITSYADVSPLEHVSIESYKDVYNECKKINTSQIFNDINGFLEFNQENFFKEKFLDFDFSKYSQSPSLKHALSCLFSEHYRQKHEIKISGKVLLHGLIPNSLIKADSNETLRAVEKLERSGFKKAKVKIGSNQGLSKENELLKKILSQAKKLTLRLDANQKFETKDFSEILKGIDIARIDYIEEPVQKAVELIHFNQLTHLNLALDENLKLMKDILIDGVKAIIIKPTLIGDYHTMKNIISMYNKRGISPIFSSSFESQVGIYQIAQLAYTLNPKEYHGLDTFDCFLETLMDLEIEGDGIHLKDHLEVQGPLYV
jgi:o-succinylbenzoate synthase